MKTLAALTVFLFSILQSAGAAVAIYAGTETERWLFWPSTHPYNDQTTQRTIYFVYDLETGRSTEIARVSGEIHVRQERNLHRLTTPHSRVSRGTSSSTTWQTILMDAKRSTTGAVVIESVTWQGSRITASGVGHEMRPATGLPYYFPVTLVSRQVFLNDSTFDLSRVSVNSSVVLQEAATKASNLAGETFEAAILRAKSILERRGR